MRKKIVVVALGGNALQPANEKWTYEELVKNVKNTCRHLISLVNKKYQLIITFGNAPQIGNLLIQQERGKSRAPLMPLDVCGAMTQGQLGYLLQKTVKNILEKPTATVITQVLVNKNDPAFKNPTKPIGPYYKTKIEKNMIKETEGWRRVVPSPKPKRIIEIEEIKTLVKKGVIVIACGGGGIPVVMKKEKLVGVEAVIDKDYASQKLATQLKAECLIFLTDVNYVYLNYGKPNQKWLDRMTVEEAKKYLEEGQFPPGSMGPKVKSSIQFLERGGKKVIITSIDKLSEAIEGKTGTVITKNN